MAVLSNPFSLAIFHVPEKTSLLYGTLGEQATGSSWPAADFLRRCRKAHNGGVVGVAKDCYRDPVGNE
mgnify:CR=1 FL=1